MKKSIALILFLIVTIVSFGNGHKNTHHVHVRAARMHIVYMKLDREIVGATLEVYSEQGKLILTQILSERKILLDFDNQHGGIYKIKIIKGDEIEEMDYINGPSLTDENENTEPIIVIQGM